MDIYVYTPEFSLVGIIDSYSSFLWNERYYKCGDFELIAPFSYELYSMLTNGLDLKNNYYLRLANSDTVMLLETIKIETDVEDGNKLHMTGRSLESILDRRVIYGQLDLDESLQTGIQKIISQNFINPTDANRKVPGMAFITSSDSAVTTPTVTSQFDFDNVYTVVTELCEANSIGFKIERTDAGALNMSLYAGVDRSDEQTARPYVIFSKEFDNLINSNYHESSENMRTVAIVAGEETEDTGRMVVEQQAGTDTPTGLYRRELYVDASGTKKEKDDETQMTDAEYQKVLQSKGTEELVDYSYEKIFESEVEANVNYIYGQDFFMGDIVTVENEYGIKSKVRVVEFIRCQDSGGYSEYPTFETV